MTSPATLAAALRAHAQGLYCLEAAAELLIAQSWLDRADFTSQFVRVHRAAAQTAGSQRPPSTGLPRSPHWAPACPVPEESIGC